MEVQAGAELCFPELLNASCRRPPLAGGEEAAAALLQAALFSVCALTVALNLLVVISVSHFRQLHTPTNLLLLSLAVSDLLVGLLSMPGEILRHTACWLLGDLSCSLYNFVSYVVTSASVGHMVLISADRYVAICDPLRYPVRVTAGRARLCACVCWLCSALYGGLFVGEDFAQPGRRSSCRGECVIVLDLVAGVLDLILTFILPVLVIVVLYLRVFVVAASQARAMRSQAPAGAPRPPGARAKKSELKAARTLGVLVLVFLMCFCPFYCVNVAAGDSLATALQFFVSFLFYFNSSVNPLIYALFYPWFRRAIRHTVSLRILQPGSSQTQLL